jgi:hypothetical protein
MSITNRKNQFSSEGITQNTARNAGRPETTDRVGPALRAAFESETSHSDGSTVGQKRRLRQQALQLQISLHQPTAPMNPIHYRWKANRQTDPAHVDWGDPQNFGNTRLHNAVAARDLQAVVRLVTECNAHPFVKNNNGWVPLALAHDLGEGAIIDYLRHVMRAILHEWQRFEILTNRRYRHRRYSKSADVRADGTLPVAGDPPPIA